MTHYIIRIIFAQLFLFIVINATCSSNYNETGQGIFHSRRVKRAPFHRCAPPNTLETIIEDEGKRIHIIWDRVERFLANHHLPVFTAHLDSWGANHRRSDAMNEVGKFIFYQNTLLKSGIIYFEETDSIFGVVDNTYIIINLRIHELRRPLRLDGLNVHKISFYQHERISDLDVLPSGSSTKFNLKKREVDDKLFNTSNIRSRRDATPESYYLEILVLVTNDIYQFFKKSFGSDRIPRLVMYYLVHFQAVDMVFSILPTNDFNIHINLAGIIIEVDNGAFSEITKYPHLSGDNKILHYGKIHDHILNYPDHFDFPFDKNSFDLIYLSTGRKLILDNNNVVKGGHSEMRDIFLDRQSDNDNSHYFPTVIVRTPDPFLTYCASAHEIGHTLGITLHDPKNKGETYDGSQCYGIMQSKHAECVRCIRWSEESMTQLTEFMSKNRNRCFLLNKPRSLYPSGTPIRSLTPCRQCQCFGYVCYGKENPNECPLAIPADSCDRPLQCRKCINEHESKLESAILPFDGTPCGEDKVCWGKKCVNTKADTRHFKVLEKGRKRFKFSDDEIQEF